MTRIPATTLLELMVALFIGAIVVGFGYSGYHLLQKGYHQKLDQENTLLETEAILSALRAQAFMASDLSFDGEKFNFQASASAACNLADGYLVFEGDSLALVSSESMRPSEVPNDSNSAWRIKVKSGEDTCQVLLVKAQLALHAFQNDFHPWQ